MRPLALSTIRVVLLPQIARAFPFIEHGTNLPSSSTRKWNGNGNGGGTVHGSFDGTHQIVPQLCVHHCRSLLRGAREGCVMTQSTEQEIVEVYPDRPSPVGRVSGSVGTAMPQIGLQKGGSRPWATPFNDAMLRRVWESYLGIPLKETVCRGCSTV